MSTHDPRDLLDSLPLVKDVSPAHLHTYRTRLGLVSVKEDIATARPVLADARMDLDGIFIPLGKVRRLLQLWPKDELAEVYSGSLCPLQVKWNRYGAPTWEHTAERRFVTLVGGRFQCLLYDAERYDYNAGGGCWSWTSRARHLEQAESAAYNEDWSRRSRRFWELEERERGVLLSLVQRKLGRAE